MDWNDLTCVVTGASSGFGRDTALRMAEKGARVVVVARRSERLTELVDQMGGEPHMFVTCDVSDLEQIRALVREVDSKVGYVDVLVNNAGIASSGPFSKSSSEEMEQVIRTNLLGSMWSTREFLPLLERAKRSSRTPVVVNVASMAGRIPLPRTADYIASKFGLVGFTESVWHDLSEKGIRTMVVEPGLADTEGFPMAEIREKWMIGWTVMDAKRVADAIVRGIEMGSKEVRVQWWLTPVYYFTLLSGPLRRYIVGFMRKNFPTDL